MTNEQAVLAALTSHEWSYHNAAENRFCQSCATAEDRWSDQVEHRPGCAWSKAREIVTAWSGLRERVDTLSDLLGRKNVDYYLDEAVALVAEIKSILGVGA